MNPTHPLAARLCALLLACASLPAQVTAPTDAEKASHDKMVAKLAELAEWAKKDHQYHGDGEAKKLWAKLDAMGARADWKLRLDAALAHMRLGNTKESIAILAHASDEMRAGRLRGNLDAASAIVFYLGMAYMRQAENDNCCARTTPESCILPLKGGAIHTKTEGAKSAIPYFELVIANRPANDYWHLSARWLLNLAHMTLGTWPDSVPEARRLPIEALKSQAELPHFKNIAGKAGLNTFDLMGGLVVDDFDGDDDLDILMSIWTTAGQMRFFRNDGNGTFVEDTKAANLTGITGGINMFQADYDNDGDVDVLVVRGAWLFERGKHPNSLLKNRGDGTFDDVTFAAGLEKDPLPSMTADWADIDNDGDLDLYVGNETTPQLHGPCRLWRNEGDGTFVDIAEDAGVQNLGYTKGVTFGDYDGDNLPDLYVSNLASANRMYRNLGGNRFEDVARKLGIDKPIASFPTWFWDYDNDGNLDLYVAAYSTGVGHIAGHHLGIKVARSNYDLMKMWRGDGKGGFTDAARDLGLDYPALPMGSNYGDLDNDGWLDFYLGTGDPYFYNLMPNLMYKNMGGKKFADVSMVGGFAHLQKGHSISYADLDSDGDLDVYAVMGGAYPGDPAYNALFENPGFGNHWLRVQLVGTTSNRSAIGARLRAVFTEDGTERSVYRHIGSGGSFGANPLRETIGVGKATKVDRLEVFWPTTGKTQTFADLAPDRAIRITEGNSDIQALNLKPTPLGGKK